MYLLITSFSQMLARITPSTYDSMQPQNNGSASIILGIGGILATLVVGLVTGIFTWKAAMKSVEQKKLSYTTQLINIFSNTIKKQQTALNNFSIKYNNKELANPNLLFVEIENTGNKSIVNPPIVISSDVEIIPGDFQDVPDGYESKWIIEQQDTNRCNICLEHINPKQIAKVFFILNGLPDRVNFSCAMQDVVINKKNSENNNKGIKPQIKINKSQKSTIALLFIVMVLLGTYSFWSDFLFNIHMYYRFFPSPIQVTLFVFITLILAILFNLFGIKRFDNYLANHRLSAIIIEISLAIVSIVLLCFIIFNILFTSNIVQIIVAIICAFMFSMLIHIVSLEK